MKKFTLIDLVRSFSILAVLAIHQDELFPNPETGNTLGSWLWEHFRRNGSYGVYCFFVVSGFLITGVIARNQGGLGKPSLREFYVQRAGRILPLFLLSVWLGLWLLMIPRGANDSNLDVVGSMTGVPGPGFWICLFTFTFNWFLAFHPLVPVGLHFSVLWSLSIEEQFYLFFPQALRKLGTIRNLIKFLISVIVLGLLWRLGAALTESNRFLQICASPGAFDNIAAGVLLYLAADKWRPALQKNSFASAILCAVGFVLTLWIYGGTSFDNRWDRVYASTLLDFGLFLFLLGGLHLPIFELKIWRPLAWPGKYCYGGYLLHPLILGTLFPLAIHLSVWKAFALTSVATTAVAALSYHLFEMPSNRIVRKTFLKQT